MSPRSSRPNARDRTIIALRGQGLTCGEIALVLDSTEGGIRSAVRWLRKRGHEVPPAAYVTRRPQGYRRYGAPATRQPIGAAARRKTLRRYERGARERGLPWLLTSADFDRLTAEPCFYCGAPPGNMRTPPGNTHGAFVHSGIDRVDNSQGYTRENAVACCARCNTLKKAVTVAIARRIVEHQDA